MDFFLVFLNRFDREKREWVMGAGFSLMVHLLPFLFLFCFFVPHYGGGGMPGVMTMELSTLPLFSDRPGGAESVAEPLKANTPDVREKAETERVVSKPYVPLTGDSVSVKEKIEEFKAEPSENRAEMDEAVDTPMDVSESAPVQTDTTANGSFRNAVSDVSGGAVFVSAGPGDPSLLNQYREMIRNAFREHWLSMSAPLAAIHSREAQLSFVVMSNGELRGLRIDRSSGDDVMDNGAVSVIRTTSPVWPHPAGVNLPFIGMTVIFTPDGVY